MKNENKVLKFNDGSNLEDSFVMNNAPTMRGRVVFKDDMGNILLEKDNLIVLRGRVYALEKLFADFNTNDNYAKNLNRIISLFKCGEGGTPEDKPFQPYVPVFSDLDLAKEIPFRIVDANDPTTFLSTEEKQLYYDGRVSALDSNLTEYFCKRFDNVDPEWHIDSVNNEVYKKIILRISTLDFRTVPTGDPEQPYGRDAKINELSLCLAYYNQVANVMEDIELFSRICFDTESLSNLTKQITVEYYIYA